MRHLLILASLLFGTGATADEADFDFKSLGAKKALRDYKKAVAKDEKATELKRKELDEEAANLAKTTRDAFVESLKGALKQSMQAGNLDEANKISDAIKALKKGASPAGTSVVGSKGKKKAKKSKARIPRNAVKWNGHHYKVFDKPVSQGQALRFCNSLGGHLVKIQTPEEQAVIISGLAVRGTNNVAPPMYWIDGSDEQVEGRWLFSDGTPMKYFAWYEGEPGNVNGKEHFIMLRDEGGGYTMQDNAYGTRVGFICEWDE